MKALRPSGTGYGYCINTYHGCSHGCLYCYARSMRRMKYERWIKAEPRSKVIDQLIADMVTVPAHRHEIHDIFVCSSTDPYQPLELKHHLTRKAVKILIENELPFTVLTKNLNVIFDLNLFRGYDKCRVGFTIITLNEELRHWIEPYSSPIDERVYALERLRQEGVSTYCSIEPIMPTKECDPIQIIDFLREDVDLFELGKWSPYSMKGIPFSYCEDYYLKLFKRTLAYCEDEGVNYCIAKHTAPFLEKYGVKFVRHRHVSQRERGSG